MLENCEALRDYPDQFSHRREDELRPEKEGRCQGYAPSRGLVLALDFWPCAPHPMRVGSGEGGGF